MGNGPGAFPKAQASDVTAARSFVVAVVVLRPFNVPVLVRRAAALLGEAGFWAAALLQIFARVFALAADEAAAGTPIGRRAAVSRLAVLTHGRGVAALFLAGLTGRALAGRLTIFLVRLTSEARFLRAEVALLTKRLLALGLLVLGLLPELLLTLLAELLLGLLALFLLAELLLGLLALFLLAALTGRPVLVLLSNRRLLSASFVLITLSHAEILS